MPIDTPQGSFLVTSFKIIIDHQSRASVLTGVLHLSALICIVSEFLLSLSDEKMRRHNLKRHIQTKHPEVVGGGIPCVKIAATQWEATPFLPPSTLEPYGRSAKMPSLSKDIAEYLSQANS